MALRERVAKDANPNQKNIPGDNWPIFIDIDTFPNPRSNITTSFVRF